ncbi:hypothetical protein INT45_001422 [Circinella minor]|uniref:t-SNARE coiled-coil homology domain-containing protein n=1 Tax=Circinella minor TaxID=1195481 RepID=A0A8H7VBD2_9FUNG|nr:hypothetical protein INT45_001422 [Circinella minor]
MSYSFSRDRTAELRGDNDGGRRDSQEFGPRRTPTGYRSAQQPPVTTANTPPPRSYRQQQNTSTVAPFDNDDDDYKEFSPARDDYDNRNHEAIEMQPTQNQRTRPPPNIQNMDGFFQEVDSLKNDISTVSDNVDRIERLHTSALVSFNEQQSRQISKDLAQIKRQTQAQNIELKDRIKALEASNARLPRDSSDAQIRSSQSTALRKRFLETIQRYQDVERTYEQKYRQRVERQIRIVKPDATQDEVDQFIDSDDSTQVFAQSLMHATRTNQARAVLSEVQTRHVDIKRIEKTIMELHQLFLDMSMLVEQQGEVLTSAEQNADQTVGHMKEGNSMISKAILSAKATRHKKWCCLFLTIGICVMIAILVWWFGFNHPGVGDGSN